MRGPACVLLAVFGFEAHVTRAAVRLLQELVACADIRDGSDERERHGMGRLGCKTSWLCFVLTGDCASFYL